MKIAHLFALIFLPFYAAQASEITAAAPVESVTLFRNQAQITRIGAIEIPAGEHKILFMEIPNSVRADSLQSFGKAREALTIKSVELKTRYLTEPASPRVATLEREIETVQGEIRFHNKEKSRAERLLSRLGDIPFSASSDESTVLRSPSEIAELLEYQDAAGAKYEKRILETERELRVRKKKLDALKKEIAGLAGARREVTAVEMSVIADKSTTAALGITYQVTNANWVPAYNMAVEDAGITLDTFGVVSQNTGEDWTGVSLRLSTAQPSIALSRPQVWSRTLDVVQHVPMARKKEWSMKAKNMSLGYMADAASMPMELEEAKVQRLSPTMEQSSNGIVEYVVPGTFTIKSDGSAEKVFVSSRELAGSIDNIVAPSRSLTVFREAEIQNEDEEMILAGSVSIFHQGNFTGKQHLKQILPGEKTRIPVGISNTLTVKRKQLERFEEDSGIVQSYRKIRASFEIRVLNHSGKVQKVHVIEPGIRSQNEKIRAVIAEQSPKSLGVKTEGRITQDGDLQEWLVAVQPKQEQEINYALEVEFKRDVPVQGLEQLL